MPARCPCRCQKQVFRDDRLVGRDAVVRFFEQARDAWDADLTKPISDFVVAGDRVVVPFVWRAHGRGPAANMEISCVAMVRDGKMLSMDFFWYHEEAPKPWGLRE